LCEVTGEPPPTYATFVLQSDARYLARLVLTADQADPNRIAEFVYRDRPRLMKPALILEEILLIHAG
jgi:hypothetical protein